MKRMTATLRQHVPHESAEHRNYAWLERARAGLAATNVAPAVMLGWDALTGIHNPLRMPCGAEAAGREFIACHWADRIAMECDLAEPWTFAAFEIENPNWQRPAHQLGIPLRTMITETVPRLKKYATNIAYAPATRYLKVEGQLRCQPVLRVLMFDLGRTDYHAGSIDNARRQLGRGGRGSVTPTRFRTLTKAVLVDEVARLLELQPRRRAVATRRCNLCALHQIMTYATLPMTMAAGGMGVAKTTLSGALGDWKASLKKRDRIKRILDSNEIFPLLSEIPIEINGERIRLPFWVVE